MSEWSKEEWSARIADYIELCRRVNYAGAYDPKLQRVLKAVGTVLYTTPLIVMSGHKKRK